MTTAVMQPPVLETSQLYGGGAEQLALFDLRPQDWPESDQTTHQLPNSVRRLLDNQDPTINWGDGDMKLHHVTFNEPVSRLLQMVYERTHVNNVPISDRWANLVSESLNDPSVPETERAFSFDNAEDLLLYLEQIAAYSDGVVHRRVRLAGITNKLSILSSEVTTTLDGWKGRRDAGRERRAQARADRQARWVEETPLRLERDEARRQRVLGAATHIGRACVHPITTARSVAGAMDRWAEKVVAGTDKLPTSIFLHSSRY